MGWTTPEAAELYSPVLRDSSELGDRQVQQLLADQNIFRLSWKKKKKKRYFILYIDVLQMEIVLLNQLR